METCQQLDINIRWIVDTGWSSATLSNCQISVEGDPVLIISSSWTKQTEVKLLICVCCNYCNLDLLIDVSYCGKNT